MMAIRFSDHMLIFPLQYEIIRKSLRLRGCPGPDPGYAFVIPKKAALTMRDFSVCSNVLATKSVRGIRLNLTTGGTGDPNAARMQFEEAVKRVRTRKWHIQFNTRPPMIAALKDVLATPPVPLVFDHFGGAPT